MKKERDPVLRKKKGKKGFPPVFSIGDYEDRLVLSVKNSSDEN